MAQGDKLKSALSRMPREKAGERLSPGVYRGAQGNLVTQGGRQIQRQPQTPQGPTPSSNLLLTNQPEGQFQWPHPQSQVLVRPIPQGNQIGAQLGAMPQMPQPSANMGGQYRLSPGVYGTRDQAMQQYNQQKQQYDGLLQQYIMQQAVPYKQG